MPRHLCKNINILYLETSLFADWMKRLLACMDVGRYGTEGNNKVLCRTQKMETLPPPDVGGGGGRGVTTRLNEQYSFSVNRVKRTEREIEIHIYREKKGLEIKRNSLWLADALSIPFPRSQNKEKTSCSFARGGKIFFPIPVLLLVSKEKKKTTYK
jgi:hypothetical protein